MFLFLCSEPLYIDDLEETLFGGLLSLRTEVDDGSIEEVLLLNMVQFFL